MKDLRSIAICVFAQYLPGYNNIDTHCIDSLEEAEAKLNDKIHKIEFSIFHINIRSIQKNFEELLVLLDNIKIAYDFIILSEAWQIHSHKNFQINDYKIHYNGANFNQNDGVVIYIHKSIIINEIIDRRINEVTFTNIQCTKNKKTYKIIATYRPPSTNPDIFIDNLNEILTTNDTQDIKIIIGDINIDILDYNNEISQRYLNLLSEKGFVPQINKPTRETESSSTCIDHLFLKNSKINMHNCPFILKTSLTDHYAAISYLLESSNKNKKPTIEIRNKINENKLMRCLQKESWTQIYNENNLEIATNKFLTIYKHIINSCTTKIYNETHNTTKKLKPWITQSLINTINKKTR